MKPPRDFLSLLAAENKGLTKKCLLNFMNQEKIAAIHSAVNGGDVRVCPSLGFHVFGFCTCR